MPKKVQLQAGNNCPEDGTEQDKMAQEPKNNGPDRFENHTEPSHVTNDSNDPPHSESRENRGEHNPRNSGPRKAERTQRERQAMAGHSQCGDPGPKPPTTTLAAKRKPQKVGMGPLGT